MRVGVLLGNLKQNIAPMSLLVCTAVAGTCTCIFDSFI